MFLTSLIKTTYLQFKRENFQTVALRYPMIVVWSSQRWWDDAASSWACLDCRCLIICNSAISFRKLLIRIFAWDIGKSKKLDCEPKNQVIIGMTRPIVDHVPMRNSQLQVHGPRLASLPNLFYKFWVWANWICFKLILQCVQRVSNAMPRGVYQQIGDAMATSIAWINQTNWIAKAVVEERYIAERADACLKIMFAMEK